MRRPLALQRTYGDEEARGAIHAVKSVGKELEPRIITIHEQFPGIFGFELSQPCVLSGETGRGVTLVNVENEVDKGGDGASGDGLDAWHSHRGGPRIGGIREGVAVSDESTGAVSIHPWGSWGEEGTDC